MYSSLAREQLRTYSGIEKEVRRLKEQMDTLRDQQNACKSLIEKYLRENDIQSVELDGIVAEIVSRQVKVKTVKKAARVVQAVDFMRSCQGNLHTDPRSNVETITKILSGESEPNEVIRIGPVKSKKKE